MQSQKQPQTRSLVLRYICTGTACSHQKKGEKKKKGKEKEEEEEEEEITT